LGYNYDDGSDQYNSSLLFHAETGTLYYIAVDGWQPGSIVLNWRKSASPNDLFADAAELSGLSGTVNGTTLEATAESGEPPYHSDDVCMYCPSVWYSWTAPESDIFYFDTEGSISGTSSAIYTGAAVDSLTKIADSIFYARAGTLYHIAADSATDTAGAFVLNWNKVIPRTSGQFEMELSGRAFLGGEQIESSAYTVFAFGPGGGSDCRGKGKFTRFGGEWGYILTIVSDIDGEEVTFRIADSSAGKLYDISSSSIISRKFCKQRP